MRQLKREANDIGVDVRLEVEPGARVALWGLFDAHIDNAKCDLNLLSKDIKRMAEDPEGRVIIGGDFNDMMFSLSDRRRLPSGVADWLQGVDDLTSTIVARNIELLWPIRNKIDCVLYGNHESAYEKNCGTNITALTVNALNMMRMHEAGLPVPIANMANADLVENLRRSIEKLMYAAAKDNPELAPITFQGYIAAMRYWIKLAGRKQKVGVSPGLVFHGAGGDAPVTKGMISITRFQTDFPVAEWSMTGHIHKATANDSPGFSKFGGGFGKLKIIPRPRVHVICGTYEINYPFGKKSTFSTEKRHAPAPLGAKRVFLYPQYESDGTLVVNPDFQ